MTFIEPPAFATATNHPELGGLQDHDGNPVEDPGAPERADDPDTAFIRELVALALEDDAEGHFALVSTVTRKLNMGETLGTPQAEEELALSLNGIAVTLPGAVSPEAMAKIVFLFGSALERLAGELRVSQAARVIESATAWRPFRDVYPRGGPAAQGDPAAQDTPATPATPAAPTGLADLLASDAPTIVSP